MVILAILLLKILHLIKILNFNNKILHLRLP